MDDRLEKARRVIAQTDAAMADLFVRRMEAFPFVLSANQYQLIAAVSLMKFIECIHQQFRVIMSSYPAYINTGVVEFFPLRQMYHSGRRKCPDIPIV